MGNLFLKVGKQIKLISPSKKCENKKVLDTWLDSWYLIT